MTDMISIPDTNRVPTGANAGNALELKADRIGKEMTTPPTRYSPLRIQLNRTARRLLWPRPAIYTPIGLMRRRGNVLSKSGELFFCGYPRSGNTFARTAFLQANPGATLQSHRHIPPFVLHQVRAGVPGLILIRRPLDAAISWAIHENQTLEEAVAYWNDYYETLMPARSGLLVARFEDVTKDFGGVIEEFNAMWGTDYARFDHTRENELKCFGETEDIQRESEGKIIEMRVCRPSAQRRMVRDRVAERIDDSSFLRAELMKANDLYDRFLGGTEVAAPLYATEEVGALAQYAEAVSR
jgi:hypothetical protein